MSDNNRKILLAVSGMSPQVITETLYALALEKHWIPDEIFLITTEQGRQNAVLQLLEGEGHFHKLLHDYEIRYPIVFTERNIIVINDAGGKPLADLRTPEDNEAAADVICSVVRDLTNCADTEVHVSLAGGRKTMGFYAGYALSLFGRPQDRLSHVLVSEHYESNPDFFYPTSQTRVIRARDGKVLDASAAKVWLAEIPFVRLRQRLPDALLKGAHSFSETVRLAREATETVRLTLYPQHNGFSINGKSGNLTGLHMALLLWMVERAQTGRVPFEPVLDGEFHSAEEIISVAEKYWISLSSKTESVLHREGITQTWLEQNISRLNKALSACVGPELAARCKLASRTFGRKRGYALPDDILLTIHTKDD